MQKTLILAQQLMQDENADLNQAINGNGDTPLIVAIKHNLIDLVKLLLEKGANPNTSNKSQNTPLMYAVLVATRSNTTDIIKLLLNMGANPNTSNKSQYTPLMYAVHYDAIAIVDLLLNAGANPELANANGETPLMVSEKKSNSKMIQLLLTKKASEKPVNNINAENLNDLSLTEKYTLGNLILMGDLIALEEFNQKKGIFRERFLSKAEYFSSSKKRRFFKKIFASVIHIMIPQYKEKELAMDDFLSYVQAVFKDIPDEKMSEKQKKEFVSHYFPTADQLLQSRKVNYNESPPALKKQAMVSYISIEQYNDILETQLDYSDYIILTYGLLKTIFLKNPINESNKAIDKLFEHIEKHYFLLDYMKCICALNMICNLLVKKGYLTLAKKVIIKNAANQCMEVVKKENLSRRFYEIRLSQYFLGDLYDENKLKAFNNLCDWLCRPQVSTPEELQKTLDYISEISLKDPLKLHDYFKEHSKLYSTRDVTLKHDEPVYSMNFGGIPSNAPSFSDFISKYPMKNKVVDRRESIDFSDAYSNTNMRHRSPFVASVSGHAYFFLALCVFYIDECKEKFISKEEKSAELNDILTILVFHYAAKGYHSFHEVLDVLNDPQMIEFFKTNYDIDITPNLSSDFFSIAMNDTLAYTKGLALKKRVHHELAQKKEKVLPILSNFEFKHSPIDSNAPDLPPLIYRGHQPAKPG